MSGSNSNSGTSGGIGFAGLLGIAFIVLKLTHYIAWSWWWVLSPLWIPAALFVLIFAVAALAALAGGKPKASRRYR